jgi:hypothetical protein
VQRKKLACTSAQWTKDEVENTKVVFIKNILSLNITILLDSGQRD